MWFGKVFVDVARRLERLYDALETGKLELSDLAPRIQLLRQRQDQLQSAKEELQDRFADRKLELADLKLVREYFEDLRNVLLQSSLAERKAFIRSFVKEVKATSKEVELLYTIPLLPKGIVQDRAEVLSIVQLGSRCRSRTCETLINNKDCARCLKQSRMCDTLPQNGKIGKPKAVAT